MENVQATFNLLMMNELKAYLGLLYFQAIHESRLRWNPHFDFLLSEKKQSRACIVIGT